MCTIKNTIHAANSHSSGQRSLPSSTRGRSRVYLHQTERRWDEINLALDSNVRVELSAVLERLLRLSPPRASQCPKCPLCPLLRKLKAKASMQWEEVDLREGRGGGNFKSVRASHDKAQSKRRKVPPPPRPVRTDSQTLRTFLEFLSSDIFSS